MSRLPLALLDDMPEDWFPPVSEALHHPNGLLAVGGDLSARRLMAAYTRGIFPWFEEGQPLLWWSPDPRAVLFPDRLRVTRSLRKRMRNGGFTVTLDRDFAAVINGCAAPRQGSFGTWITPDMVKAYGELHDRGIAHSVEVWRNRGLVGGLYGVALGRIFFGESMFSNCSDASKIALVALARQLDDWGYQLVDCQIRSQHLATLGARCIPRQEFIARLQRGLLETSRPGHWNFDADFNPLSVRDGQER